MGMKKESFRKKEIPDCGQDDKFNKSLVSYESSSESEGESQFNFEFLDSECEEFLDGKRLTTLVRRSYLRHLHQTLNENYKIWSKASLTNDKDPSSGTAIAMCASELEKKALRACMMTNIYQRAMVQLMQEVRKSTKHSKLHNELINQMNSTQRSWCDKESQTDNFSNLSNDLVIKTSNINLSNKVNNFIQPIPVAMGQVKETIAKVHPLQKDSIFKQVEESLRNEFETSPNLSIPAQNLTPNPLFESVGENPVPHQGDHLDLMKIEKRKLHVSETPSKKYGVPSPKKKCTAKNNLLQPVKHKENLEERLLKLTSLFGDSDGSPDSEVKEVPVANTPSPKRKCPIFNWHFELVAQVCNINNILLNMKSQRRTFLEKRFKDLFGGENDPVTNITVAETIYCRKRIAEMVVAELTPLYLACRIGSKLIFKELAKQITNKILNRTFAPGVNIGRGLLTVVCCSKFNDSIQFRLFAIFSGGVEVISHCTSGLFLGDNIPRSVEEGDVLIGLIQREAYLPRYVVHCSEIDDLDRFWLFTVVSGDVVTSRLPTGQFLGENGHRERRGEETHQQYFSRRAVHYESERDKCYNYRLVFMF